MGTRRGKSPRSCIKPRLDTRSPVRGGAGAGIRFSSLPLGKLRSTPVLLPRTAGPCHAEPGREGCAASFPGAGQGQPLPGKGGGEAGPSPGWRGVPLSRAGTRWGRVQPLMPPHRLFFVTQINRVILVGAALLSCALAAPCQPSREGARAVGDPPRETRGYRVHVLPAESVADLHVAVLILGSEAGEADGLAAEVAQVDEAGGLRAAEGGHRHQQHPLPSLPCGEMGA